uniref:Uncharacterized protein n=1 Tax=Zea mays TaxID=4577 RepID=A0A804M7R7_MAIZE
MLSNLDAQLKVCNGKLLHVITSVNGFYLPVKPHNVRRSLVGLLQQLSNAFANEKHNEQFLESQTRWRQHRAYAAYKQQQKASLILQCLWRARIARKELRKLRMEARETGALKEAKDKLEKRVEELTWRLDVEKRLRADLEEAKSHEIEKLQSALQKMQENLEEAHAAIVNEKEAAKLAIEQAPPKIVEVSVIDNAKLEELTTQNKELEDELSTFKQKAEDLENKLIEFQKQSDELSQETQEQASKVTQLQELVERLEASLSNMESENQVLRQQLESKIATLESEIELLHSNSALAIQVVVTPEMNQTTVIEEFDKGHQLEEVKTVNVCAISFTWQTFMSEQSIYCGLGFLSEQSMTRSRCGLGPVFYCELLAEADPFQLHLLHGLYTGGVAASSLARR